MKYSANFNANNGTTLQKPFMSNNRNELIKLIRDCAGAERFSGNVATWSVWVTDTFEVIASGCIHDGGYVRYI